MSRARHRARRFGLVWRQFIRTWVGSWAPGVLVRYAVLALLPLVLVSSTLTYHGNARLPSVDRPVTLIPAVLGAPAFVAGDTGADPTTPTRVPAPQVTVTARPQATGPEEGGPEEGGPEEGGPEEGGAQGDTEGDEKKTANTIDPATGGGRTSTTPEGEGDRDRAAQGPADADDPASGESDSRPPDPASTTEPTSEPSTPDPSPTERETEKPTSSPTPPPAPNEPEPDEEEDEEEDDDNEDPDEREDDEPTKICINLPKLPICLSLG